MANDILTLDAIADRALATLYETTVMAQLIHRDYSAEFVPGRGRTISVRKPTTFAALPFNRADGITVQNANEDAVEVTMDRLIDTSFAVTAEEWTLDIDSFDERFITPAMDAISQYIDNDILDTFRADVAAYVVGTTGANAAGEDYTGYAGSYPWSDSRVLIQAGQELNKRKVPMINRNVVVGPTTAALWVAEKRWRDADKVGDTVGLRDAMLRPTMHGFTPYMTQNVDQPAQSPASGQPTTEVNLAFHPDAFALVTRPLALPKGATDARIVNYKGFGLRVISGYSQDTKEDVISIDVLYGLKTLDAARATLIRGALA